jgi:hypothetical protein
LCLDESSAGSAGASASRRTLDIAKHAIMVRRASILIAALTIAVIVYIPVFYALLRRAMFVLFPIVHIHGGRDPVPNDYVYGYPVPMIWVITLWFLLPLMYFAFEFCRWLQRLNRERLGLCLDCGSRLVSPWRGKCPRCGLRIGPG